MKSSSGFTIIELVLVIALLGILSAGALSRFFDLSIFQQRGFYDETVSAVRYAQKLAVASGCDVQVTLGTGGYALMQRAACDTSSAFTLAVTHPAGTGNFAGSPPNGVSVSTATIIFTPLGQATNAARVSTDYSALSVGGKSFNIVGETGYVDTP